MMNLLMVNISRMDKRLKIAAIANRLGLSVKSVGKEDFGKAVGTLAGLPGTFPEGEGAVFSDEMLVLCGVDEGIFQEFLAAIRAQKVPVVLKAVLTEHNASWSVSALYSAIAQEHEAMKKGLQSPHRGK